ncbi:MAG: hypothetical protein GX602_01700 [Dehalococcoidales bacterium]|jgi:pyruvate,water dikinase|nr:hypothetical protein [Dehalococcoidales bacterium]NLE89644.1 hypothetical protein [Dehalococcoidales bacterium]
MTGNNVKYPEQVTSTGSLQLDRLLMGLFPGDNVVWQVDSLDEYSYFAVLFAKQAVRSGYQLLCLLIQAIRVQSAISY